MFRRLVVVSFTHAQRKNGAYHHRDRRQSPWNRNVIVTGVNAQDYLATPKPAKLPKKNKLNKPGGTVFKKISN